MRMSTPGKLALALLLAIVAAPRTLAQQCPQLSAKGAEIQSEVRPLEGALIYHDGIRQWFELKLDHPQCGQPSIQLVAIEDEQIHQLEILRGCRVQSTGSIYDSPTGYYSLDLAQDVKAIEPIGACEKKPLFPDYSKAEPDKAILSYRVVMDVDYRPGDDPIVFHVSSAGKELRPWQAFASYMLTGGFVLYGKCADGFVVDKVFGTPQANPSHFTQALDSSDMAAFDPESAAAAGITNLHLGYTCVRQ